MQGHSLLGALSFPESKRSRDLAAQLSACMFASFLSRLIQIHTTWVDLSFPNRYPTTSVLTAADLIYAIGAGITAAAGTRLALQLILVKGFMLYSFQLQNAKRSVLVFIVTTSPCQDWVIYAPAAFLGCGSRFSGSLSGIEP